MPNENPQSRLELVESLATSIQKKLVKPAEDRVELVNCEIKDFGERVTALEQKVFLLVTAHTHTSLLTRLSLAVAALLVLSQIFLHVR